MRPRPCSWKRSAVQLLLEALHALTAHRLRRNCVREPDARAHDSARDLARGGSHLQLAAALELDQQRSCRHERPAALGDELEDDGWVRLAAERTCDLRGRLEPGDGALQLVAVLARPRITTGVVDREAREPCEHDDRLARLRP